MGSYAVSLLTELKYCHFLSKYPVIQFLLFPEVTSQVRVAYCRK